MNGIIDVGGGMRGVYSAGIYDYLIDNKIEFDYALGVSAGSANLISYVAHQRGRDFAFYYDYTFRKEYMSAGNLFRKHCYLDLDYVYSTLTNEGGEYPLDYDTAMNSDCIFKALATDAVTGRPHFFDKNDLKRNDYYVMKASCAIPVICGAYYVDGRYYFDGGIADPVPYRKAIQDGCDFIVAVLSRPRDYTDTSQPFLRFLRPFMKNYPAVMEEIATRLDRYNEEVAEIKEMEKKGKALIIAPEEGYGVDTLTKNKTAFKNLYEEGYRDAAKIAELGIFSGTDRRQTEVIKKNKKI